MYMMIIDLQPVSLLLIPRIGPFIENMLQRLASMLHVSRRIHCSTAVALANGIGSLNNFAILVDRVSSFFAGLLRTVKYSSHSIVLQVRSVYFRPIVPLRSK